MTEKSSNLETTPFQLSQWTRFGNAKAPKLIIWMLVSTMAAGAMLYLSPIQHSSRNLVSIIVVLLAPLVLCLAWITGISNFAASCETFRRATRTAPLAYLLPILLATIFALGLLGSRYWWLFSIAIAIQGFRKGVRRAWWSAVTFVAFGLRSLDETFGPRLFANDEDALAAAIESINKEVSRGPSKRC